MFDLALTWRDLRDTLTPTVDKYRSLNLSSTKRLIKLVLPTLKSPNKQIFLVITDIGWVWVGLLHGNKWLKTHIAGWP